MLSRFMRIVAFVVLLAILFVPLQETEASVNVVAGITSDKLSVSPGEEFVVCVFVNVTLYYNETPTDLWNGSIKINVTMKIPEGLNVTRISYGEQLNDSIHAHRDNATFAQLYVKLNATEEGDYTLSAEVNVTYVITIRKDNATPVYLNDTVHKTTNVIRIHVAQQQIQEEERNRLGLYDSLRSRVLQAILGLMLLGFIINNFVADRRAKRS